MDGKKYIILEIIPTAVDPKKGEVAQLSALKINGLKLMDRFDYRIVDSKVNNIDIRNMLDYDNADFTYVNTTRIILSRFKKWIEDYDLLILDNLYTRNYLEKIDNNKESILDYLDMEYSDDVIEKIMEKYNLVPSFHIVDLLYEALIYENGSEG